MRNLLDSLVREVESPKYSQPLISILTAFGFLPGKEIKDAKVGNLGIQDRESLVS